MGRGTPTTGDRSDQVVAEVGKEPITAQEVEQQIQMIQVLGIAAQKKIGGSGLCDTFKQYLRRNAFHLQVQQHMVEPAPQGSQQFAQNFRAGRLARNPHTQKPESSLNLPQFRWQDKPAIENTIHGFIGARNQLDQHHRSVRFSV